MQLSKLYYIFKLFLIRFWFEHLAVTNMCVDSKVPIESYRYHYKTFEMFMVPKLQQSSVCNSAVSSPINITQESTQICIRAPNVFAIVQREHSRRTHPTEERRSPSSRLHVLARLALCASCPRRGPQPQPVVQRSSISAHAIAQHARAPTAAENRLKTNTTTTTTRRAHFTRKKRKNRACVVKQKRGCVVGFAVFVFRF